MERLGNRVVEQFPLAREGGRLMLADVGSMNGIGAEREPLRDHLQVLGFEPDEREFSRPHSSENETHLPLVLADEPRDLLLHISLDPGKISIYEPNWELLADFPFLERWKTVDRVRFPAERVSTLDRCLESEGLRAPDFLKLDTQGSELLILRGRVAALSQSVLAACAPRSP